MNKGFTILELMITVFVFITGVLGVFMIAQNFVFNTQVSISRLTASFLAQEGIEIVRNLRDENWLNNRNWNYGLNDNCQTGYGISEWQSAYNDVGLSCVLNGGLIYFDNSGLFSHYSGGSPTKFKRKIIIESVDETIPPDSINDYLEVKVLVNWEEKGRSYQVEAQENLYPWWSY